MNVPPGKVAVGHASTPSTAASPTFGIGVGFDDPITQRYEGLSESARLAMADNPLDVIVKGQWVLALRSGDYEQCKGMLRSESLDDPPTYCCLGVACNLIDPSAWVYSDDDDTYSVLTGWRSVLNEETVGLPFIDSVSAGILAEFNDATAMTFSDIATFIERYL